MMKVVSRIREFGEGERKREEEDKAISESVPATHMPACLLSNCLEKRLFRQEKKPSRVADMVFLCFCISQYIPIHIFV